MAFELFKAKMEAKKARRDAIFAIDKYVNALSIQLPNETDQEKRKAIMEEMSRLVSIKEVYKKNTELPKWAQEMLTTGLKLATLAGSVVACEVITNRGTGDKIITDGIKRLPGL